eukprot:CAMPEP_0185763886 /NCGR_PEP_ID=MMETSP1174-20130828/22792_1 /TAXON_ID=35687 /ORGANISM="Dictyocha speculum, Strain CCMP1381" /LENGTH=56 /DNA_ID=CAMNT_0028446183 /DNA_START=425 /DNA_END=592 /DNA_ORIENTATION=-
MRRPKALGAAIGRWPHFLPSIHDVTHVHYDQAAGDATFSQTAAQQHAFHAAAAERN